MSAEGTGPVPGDHADRIRWNAKWAAGSAPSFTPHPLAVRALALDVPARTRGLAGLLAALDRLVVEAGGRVYLAKDSRVPPAALAEMYPRLPDFRKLRADLDPDGILASDRARFGIGFIKIGLVPELAATRFLTHRMGPGRSRLFALSGDLWTADEALMSGLVDRVAALDGRLEVDSPAGEGTRLRAEIPVTREE